MPNQTSNETRVPSFPVDLHDGAEAAADGDARADLGGDGARRATLKID